MPHLTVLGIMSGTSLDGVDLCLTDFNVAQEVSYNIQKSITIAYPSKLKERLSDLNQSMTSFLELDVELMTFFSEQIEIHFGDMDFQLISSHGQTIFHNPSKKYTYQLGSGGILSKLTGKPVVSDFRTEDIILGGQGAPLVPIGDRDLFSHYDNCLNLGGFANVSFQSDQARLAFDICPLNIVLNRLANSEGLEFDDAGAMASKGDVDEVLLHELNNLTFYKQSGPKSLGAEWVNSEVMPLLSNPNLATADLLATFSQHAAVQIAPNLKPGSCLVTGGGAFNIDFLQRLRNLYDGELVIPETDLINFKEALIFAYIGLLRFLKRENVLCSVTGASRNTCSGSINLP